jgi:hypothetical protein
MIVDVLQVMSHANVDFQLLIADVHVFNGGLLVIMTIFRDRQFKKLVHTVTDVLREAEFLRFRELVQDGIGVNHQVLNLLQNLEVFRCHLSPPAPIYCGTQYIGRKAGFQGASEDYSGSWKKITNIVILGSKNFRASRGRESPLSR